MVQSSGQARCKAVKQDGAACNGRSFKGGAYCWFHAPETADDRAAGRRLGGVARSNENRARKALPAALLSTEELHSWLGVVFTRVIAGKMDPPIATAAANVARTMAELNKSAVLEEKLTDLARQVADLAGRQSA